MRSGRVLFPFILITSFGLHSASEVAQKVYDLGIYQEPVEETTYEVTSPSGYGLSIGSVKSGYCSDEVTRLNDAVSISGISYFLNSSTSTPNYSTLSFSVNCFIIKRDTRYDPAHANYETNVTGGISGTLREIVTDTCAEDSLYEVPFSVDEQLYCTTALAMSENDTCPSSSSDYNYVLPVTNATPYSSTCLVKDDGSRCEYNLSSDETYFSLDFENNCYGLPYEFPEYAESDTQIDEEDTSCQNLGNDVYACPEDEANVCSNGVCQEGCGEVQIGDDDPVFVCLSNDTDGDGIGDYADPDIDGDGIANDEDLDSDGDGQDDPDYGDGSGDGAIDLTETNAILDDARNGIGSVNEGLGALNNTATSIEEKLDELAQVEVVEKGVYPTQEEEEAAIALAQEELIAILNEIKLEMDSIFSITTPTAEFFGCYDIASVNGSVKSSCATPYQDELEIIALAVLFIFGLLSVVIIFR